MHETKQGMTKPRLEFTYLNPTRKAIFSAISPYLFVCGKNSSIHDFCWRFLRKFSPLFHKKILISWRKIVFYKLGFQHFPHSTKNEEILNGKLHFLCSTINKNMLSNKSFSFKVVASEDRLCKWFCDRRWSPTRNS